MFHTWINRHNGSPATKNSLVYRQIQNLHMNNRIHHQRLYKKRYKKPLSDVVIGKWSEPWHCHVMMTLPLPSHHPPQAENPGSRTCNDDNLNNWGKLKTTTNLHHWTCPLHRQARCKTCQKKDKRREWTIFTETWFQRKIWQEDVEAGERCSLWRKLVLHKFLLIFQKHYLASVRRNGRTLWEPGQRLLIALLDSDRRLAE